MSFCGGVSEPVCVCDARVPVGRGKEEAVRVRLYSDQLLSRAPWVSGSAGGMEEDCVFILYTVRERIWRMFGLASL